MIFPTLHLGGSAGSSLIYDLLEAKLAVGAAIDKLQDAAPNARDYPEGSFEQAVAEHADRVRRLASVGHELRELAENISEQRDKRNR
jgi:hypothetical protein